MNRNLSKREKVRERRGTKKKKKKKGREERYQRSYRDPYLWWAHDLCSFDSANLRSTATGFPGFFPDNSRPIWHLPKTEILCAARCAGAAGSLVVGRVKEGGSGVVGRGHILHVWLEQKSRWKHTTSACNMHKKIRIEKKTKRRNKREQKETKEEGKKKEERCELFKSLPQQSSNTTSPRDPLPSSSSFSPSSLHTNPSSPSPTLSPPPPPPPPLLLLLSHEHTVCFASMSEMIWAPYLRTK